MKNILSHLATLITISIGTTYVFGFVIIQFPLIIDFGMLPFEHSQYLYKGFFPTIVTFSLIVLFVLLSYHIETHIKQDLITTNKGIIITGVMTTIYLFLFLIKLTSIFDYKMIFILQSLAVFPPIALSIHYLTKSYVEKSKNKLIITYSKETIDHLTDKIKNILIIYTLLPIVVITVLIVHWLNYSLFYYEATNSYIKPATIKIHQGQVYGFPMSTFNGIDTYEVNIVLINKDFIYGYIIRDQKKNDPIVINKNSVITITMK